MNDEMKARAKCVKGEWKDEGDGYYSLIGISPIMTFKVAYLALPKNHPDNGKFYDELEPTVNGGLTYSRGNIFGWDYGHSFNPSNPKDDVQTALSYFKGRK